MANSIQLKEKTPHGDTMFPLKVHVIDTDTRFRERLNYHWHDEIEFLVVTQGQADFHIDAESYRASAGELLFINSNRLHYATAVGNEPCAFFAVVFNPALLKSYNSDNIQLKYIDTVLNAEVIFSEHIQPCEEWEKRAIALLNDIRSLYCGLVPAYELQIKIKLYEIWFLLYSHSKSSGSVGSSGSDYRIARIKAILEYLQDRYQQKISLAELSGAFHMSEGQFCRFFKSMVKMPVMDYLNSYRINTSAALLLKTDKAISEIAGMVGFNNISYFNKIFRKYMHCSPSEYRKSNR
jgi:AraC-like DNA-binding protein/mannose-6-phosphate isomerase-like protein (cupin superfamily)